MPKSSTTKHDSATTTTSGPMGSASHPNVLKRNQACHQCRRRKLKCDAQRPCSTCVRSHAHALSHAPAGVEPPERPECTFDEVVGPMGAQEAPKNRYEKLENRINELEAMLRDQGSSSASKSPQSSLSPPSAHSPNVPIHPGLTGATIPTPPVFHSPSLGLPQSYQSSPGDYPGISSSSTSFIASAENPSNEVQTDTPFLSPGLGYDVYWPGWPKDLPSPALVRHLVEAFFSFHPHAGRLFHVPTFMASIDLPPTHPNFPSPAIIHAICAVGSLYTVAVPPTPPPEKSMGASMSEHANLGDGSSDHSPLADEIFGSWYKRKDYIDSFAERHVKLAKQTAEEQLLAGKTLLEDVQAMLIITWWYWCNARWVESFTTIGQAIRAAIPLGINVNPPFFPISDSLRTPSLILLPKDSVEDEVRRNTFWLLYAMERMGGCSNGWALSLDDQDVSQLLPMRDVNFDLGITWSGSERQHALGKDILLHHPEDQVDSFSLYIKGCMLLSRVKVYNLRFRSKRFVGDPAFTYASTYAEAWEKVGDEGKDKAADPRRTSGFLEIDHIASMFRQSFPLYLRNPIRDSSVDSHLYTACLTPHLAIILLHDPHAHVKSPGCVSAFKILEASRAVLDLIYAVRSTSFDVTLLDFFCAFCWFRAGRVLVRFWQAAQQANSKEQTLTLRSEVEYIIAALAKLGERVPLAHRYFLMLSEVASKERLQHS
ncbi:hypothetical protein EDB92DRAFT_1893745 [Lactarius akahatsu]|uniref:Zn(2)-C6 fungal-type domain-containing protein n=1 Tax=Lactarius akahatsu TaxID=416441 RepID=A0AAD4Q976_9AGAM|nr:hypothetical protein EDB92DRAFT_1893745 [Lactarius akahatsu]